MTIFGGYEIDVIAYRLDSRSLLNTPGRAKPGAPIRTDLSSAFR